MSEVTLSLNFSSYWHIGSGDEAGSYADALALKDHNGLPYVPGKSLKGVLREALEKAIAANWFSPQLLELLLGREGESGYSSQGVLQVSSARLSAAEEAYFLSPATSAQAKQALYRVIHSTKLDDQGVAQDGSLRAVEVVVPMALKATLSLNTLHPHYAQVMTMIDHDFAHFVAQNVVLINGIGAKRTRGYGAVDIAVERAKEAVA